ncbi:hypothetical protein MRX96_030557 [Rhipicephalus microplus]
MGAARLLGEQACVTTRGWREREMAVVLQMQRRVKRVAAELFAGNSCSVVGELQPRERRWPKMWHQRSVSPKEPGSAMGGNVRWQSPANPRSLPGPAETYIAHVYTTGLCTRRIETIGCGAHQFQGGRNRSSSLHPMRIQGG